MDITLKQRFLQNFCHKKVLIIGDGLTAQSYNNFFNTYYPEVELINYIHNRPLNSPTATIPPHNTKPLGQTTIQNINLDSISLALLSPGLGHIYPHINPMLQLLKANLIPILTDVDIFNFFTPHLYKIAITGSNGKSSLTDMLTYALNTYHIKALAMGNIGLPLLNNLQSIFNNNCDYAIIELSSYQLLHSNNLFFQVAVLCNIYSNHLDYHGTLNNYIAAKYKIFNTHNLELALNYEAFNSNFAQFNALNKPIDYCNITQLSLKYNLNNFCHLGVHNINNWAVVLKILEHLSSYQAVLQNININKLLETYKFLPHRQNIIYQNNNLLIVNDSKSTNVRASITAIERFNMYNQPLVLLLGGRAKPETFSLLLRYAIIEFIVFGESAIKINQDLKNIATHFNTCKEALNYLLNKYEEGIILFSPGCASFDEFKNFEDRGNFFTMHVKDFLQNKLNSLLNLDCTSNLHKNKPYPLKNTD